MAEHPETATNPPPKDATIAVVDEDGVVVAASVYRSDDQADYQRAVDLVNDGIRSTDRIVKFLNGEQVRLGKPVPGSPGGGS